MIFRINLSSERNKLFYKLTQKVFCIKYFRFFVILLGLFLVNSLFKILWVNNVSPLALSELDLRA